jgi:hypothetical protein
MENKLNWLAFESGILTPQFQKLHLVTHYLILAVGLVAYLAGTVDSTGIVIACLPGAAWFVISLEALAWKKVNESGNVFDLMDGFIK